MSNDFDPVLRAQNKARKAERAREAAAREDKARLTAFLKEHNLVSVDDDPSLMRIKGVKHE